MNPEHFHDDLPVYVGQGALVVCEVEPHCGCLVHVLKPKVIVARQRELRSDVLQSDLIDVLFYHKAIQVFVVFVILRHKVEHLREMRH